MVPYYNSFGAVQYCEAVEETLKQQIDFNGLKEMGIIEDHFHLHKKDNIESINQSVSKYQWKIIMKMMCCKGFVRKLQPLNIIKDYMGEKVAYEHAFLIHYIGWLFYPSILGLALFGF